MTHLATPDSPLVWEAVTRALTRNRRTERSAATSATSICGRPPSSSRSVNVEDATVADAVADARTTIAAAIDAIVERLEARRPARLRRRRHVRADRRGRCCRVRPDVLDRPDRRRDTEVEADGGRRGAVAAISTSARQDVVLGVSASGRTPYTLGALGPRARRGRADDRRSPACAAPSSPRGRPRDRGRRRAGGHLRLDAHEGRHGAEARPQHDLDRDDGEARQDVREPDGRRRRRRTRSCAHARAPPSRSRRRRPRTRSPRRSPRQTETRRSRSSRCSQASTRETARSRLSAAGGVIREAVADVVG